MMKSHKRGNAKSIFERALRFKTRPFAGGFMSPAVDAIELKFRSRHARLYRRARASGNQDGTAKTGCVAKSISRIRNHDAVSGIYVHVPKDGFARLRNNHDRIYAEEILH